MAWEIAFFLFHLRSQPDVNYRWKVDNVVITYLYLLLYGMSDKTSQEK